MNDSEKNIILNNSDYSTYIGSIKQEDCELLLKEYLDFLSFKDSYYIEYLLRLVKERYIHFPELMVMFQYPTWEVEPSMENQHIDLIGNKNVLEFVESSKSRKLLVHSMFYNTDRGSSYDYVGQLKKEDILIVSSIYKHPSFNYFKYYIRNESSLKNFDSSNLGYKNNLVAILTILSIYQIPLNIKLLTLIMNEHNPNHSNVKDIMEDIIATSKSLDEYIPFEFKMDYGHDKFIDIFNKYFNSFGKYIKLIEDIEFTAFIPEIKELGEEVYYHHIKLNKDLIDSSKQIYLKHKLNQDTEDGEI